MAIQVLKDLSSSLKNPNEEVDNVQPMTGCTKVGMRFENPSEAWGITYVTTLSSDKTFKINCDFKPAIDQCEQCNNYEANQTELQFIKNDIFAIEKSN